MMPAATISRLRGTLTFLATLRPPVHRRFATPLAFRAGAPTFRTDRRSAAVTGCVSPRRARRAPDSLGYNEHISAVAAITAQHLEETLTRRFCVEWVARDDGHGFEIKGISGEMMRLFSSRRESITADLRARAARFEQHYGRAPS
jgi:hypothetical protein